MKLVSKPLSDQDIEELLRGGSYYKLTADLKRSVLVIGGDLHADAERLLLEGGSFQDDIWGGGIDLETKEVETTAVLNLRPRLGNDSLEILDPELRRKFINLVKVIFEKLWS